MCCHQLCIYYQSLPFFFSGGWAGGCVFLKPFWMKGEVWERTLNCTFFFLPSPDQVDIANFELFSSMPKEFAVLMSDRYPTRDWTPLGIFTALDQKVVQSFELHSEAYGKYIKVTLVSFLFWHCQTEPTHIGLSLIKNSAASPVLWCNISAVKVVLKLGDRVLQGTKWNIQDEAEIATGHLGFFVHSRQCGLIVSSSKLFTKPSNRAVHWTTYVFQLRFFVTIVPERQSTSAAMIWSIYCAKCLNGARRTASYI